MRKVLYREEAKVGYSEMDNEGYFHEWIKVNNVVCAIIERKDGSIDVVYCYLLKFVESPDSIDLEQKLYEVVKELLINISTDSSVIRHINELLKDLKQ